MNPLMGEAEAQLGDQTFRLVMNNAAWIAVEHVLDESYLDILAEMVRREMEGKSPKISVSGALLWGALRAHHPELSLSQCGDLMMEHASAFTEPLGTAIRASIKLKDPEPGEATTPAAEASAAGGTGTSPLSDITKQEEGA